MGGAPRNFSSLLVQNVQFHVGRVGLHGRLIHQLGPRGRDFEFAGYQDPHRVPEGRVAVEIVDEDDRALVAEFAVDVPIAPPPVAVIEIDSADAFDLFAAGGDRVFYHQVLRARALQPQPRHDQVARTQFPRERLHLPTRFAAAFVDAQPQVLALQLQGVRRLRRGVLLARVVIERRGGVKHARTALDHSRLIGAGDLVAFEFDDHRLPGGGFRRGDVAGQDLFAVQIDLDRVIGGKLAAGFHVIAQSEYRERRLLRRLPVITVATTRHQPPRGLREYSTLRIDPSEGFDRKGRRFEVVVLAKVEHRAAN